MMFVRVGSPVTAERPFNRGIKRRSDCEECEKLPSLGDVRNTPRDK